MSKRFKDVYQFKVALKGIQPPIWRRIQVPENFTFWDFHVAIQDVMGWEDCHSNEFEMVNPHTGLKEEIGIPDEDIRWDDREILPAWNRKISEYFASENKKGLYTYDFGDDWRHDVELEKILPREKNVTYPICLAGKRACPPEDCGGVWGYGELLEILADPNHEQHEDMLEWLGESFDPEYFGIKEVQFDDPQERWNYAFGDDAELDEIPAPESEDEIEKQVRVMHREHMRELWEKAKNNDLDDLDTEQRRLANIMLDHEDEFSNQFEFADATAEHEYDPDTEVNPFLHISIHSVVEKQLEERDPIEAFQFYNAMRQKKVSHHDAIHLIGMILSPLMFGVLKDKKPFDLETYKRLLKKCKTRKPEKIPDLLDKEQTLFE